jgi:hypothetical protein
MNNLNVYFNFPNLKIFYLEGNFDDLFIKQLNNNCYIFYQFTWNIEFNVINNNNSFLNYYESIFTTTNTIFNFKTNFIFCAPDEIVNNYILKNGYSSILLNHNAFLDYNLYSIGEKEKIYDAVINSRPFWWKRVYLAHQVNNLLYIKGNDWAKNETSWDGYKNMDCTIKSEISRCDVNLLYQESKCGLILSGNTGENQQGLNEGANYSTGEYLLCGLPVISTPNQGGRNFWLDSYNSIICEPNEISVKNAVSIMLNKIENNEIDRKNIRNECVNKINALRSNFIEKTNEIFKRHNININSYEYFNKHFFHKMCNYNFTLNKLDEIF